MRINFKNTTASHQLPRPRIIIIIAFTTALIGIIVISLVVANPDRLTLTDSSLSTTHDLTVTPAPVADKHKDAANHTLSIPIPPAKPIVAEAAATPIPAVVDTKHRITVVVKKGDTLSSIFSDLDIHTELIRILSLGQEVKPFKKIYPGQKLHFTLGEDGIDRLEFEQNITRSLFLQRDGESFVVGGYDREPDKVTQVASGTIHNSLFVAGQNAGMSDGLIMQLAGIFGWDIDFALDIRQGDSFTVLYEELYLDDEKIDDGNIVAAEFINDETTYRAYRYTDSHGKTEYYSTDGSSMRKPFLRTPVNLARISSYFNLRRKHPVLNRIRAHKGVDYAAATGTPIMASGDGKVMHRGNKGGYGKTIILRHGSTYTTLYAHMSRYARGTSVGSRVRQGQIIGYIGSTGLSTGPHLHYEFRVNGVHRNPLRVRLPSAISLPGSEMENFQTAVQPLVVQLDAYSQNALVMRDL